MTNRIVLCVLWVSVLFGFAPDFTQVSHAGELEFGRVLLDGVSGVEGLNGANSVVVSPDGRHVYVAGSSDNAVAIFARNVLTGELTFLDAEISGVGGVSGLDGAFSIALSPDGEFAYVAGSFDDAIAVFSRDASTGALSFVEAVVDGLAGVDGLDGVVSVTVSADGNHVYAAGSSDNAVAVFARSGAAGTLTFVEAEIDEIGGASGLAGAFSVSVSPDGAHVYVAGSNDNALAVFARNAGTGALTFVETQVDGEGGTNGLALARSVVVSPDGNHVYAAGTFDDAIAVFARNSGSGALTFVESLVDGAGGIVGLDGAFSVSVSPDGTLVYAAGLLGDALAVFSRNSMSGELTFLEAEVDGAPVSSPVEGLDGAASIAASSDGRHVYVAGSNDDAVALFSNAVFRLAEVRPDNFAGFDGLEGVRDFAISPGGEHVYSLGVLEDEIGVFALDEDNSTLAFVEVEQNNQAGVVSMSFPSSLSLSPDGQDLYVTSPAASALIHFSRDNVSGELTHQSSLVGLGNGTGLFGANQVVVSPDGAHVYVGLLAEPAVSVWSRDSVTGALTFVEIQSELGGPVSGLSQVVDLALSPDGSNVYAAAVNSVSGEAGAIFSRNASTGGLSFVGTIAGFGATARALSVSPAGDTVYLVDDGRLTSFERTGAVGNLIFSESTVAGAGDGIAISADGTQLLVVNSVVGSLQVFARDFGTGDLLPAQLDFDDVAGVDGLAGALSVVLTPSAEHALVAGSAEDSLALFAAPEPGFGAGLAAALGALAWQGRLLARRRRSR